MLRSFVRTAQTPHSQVSFGCLPSLRSRVFRARRNTANCTNDYYANNRPEHGSPSCPFEVNNLVRKWLVNRNLSSQDRYVLALMMWHIRRHQCAKLGQRPMPWTYGTFSYSSHPRSLSSSRRLRSSSSSCSRSFWRAWSRTLPSSPALPSTSASLLRVSRTPCPGL